MRFQRRQMFIVGIATAILLILLLLVWWLIPPSGPRYQGKPLSYWLAGFDGRGGATSIPMKASGLTTTAPNGALVVVTTAPAPAAASATPFPSPTTAEAEAAVETVGTNAIPTLLRLLRVRDTTLRAKFVTLAGKQHFIHIDITPASTLNERALAGFRVLGLDVTPAIPELSEIYRHNPPTQVSNELAQLFSSLGTYEPTDNSVIPALIKVLDDPDLACRANAAIVLGRYGSAASSAIPTLENHQNDDFVGDCVRQALRQILSTNSAQ